jgi:hypothetical protein
MRGGGNDWDLYGGENAAIGPSGYVSLDALSGSIPEAPEWGEVQVGAIKGT